MIVLSGAHLVLPDRMLSPGTLVIDGDRIVDIRSGGPSGASGSSGSVPSSTAFAFHNHYIVPAFIDVHVHGLEDVDALDEGDPISAMAARLPRHGVAAFCPTTVACTPDRLARVLDQVRRARATLLPRSARVLPAHIESNFINPAYNGAQPAACLRSPRAALERLRLERGAGRKPGEAGPPSEGERGWDPASSEKNFKAVDILREIERSAPDVGIVTIAPELGGGLDLVAWLSARGHRVSLGHSAATYDEALAAIAAGARQATHLFNGMPPIHHRAPGLAGAMLQAEEVAVELVCDAVHVHPALVRTTVATKAPSRVLAITDGTAASGLPAGRRTRLGDQPITVGERAAHLDDGTLAGSVLTMDRAFRTLVEQIGLSPVDAATMCATTPARELGLVGHGILARDAIADLVVLDARLSVVQTYIGGQLVYARSA